MGWFSKKEPEPEPDPPTAVEQAQAAAAALQEQAGALFSSWMTPAEEPKKKSKKEPIFKPPPPVVKKSVVVKKVPTKKPAKAAAPKMVVPKKVVPKNVPKRLPISKEVSLDFESPETSEPPAPLPPRQRPAGVSVVSSLEELVREIPQSKGEEDFLLAQRDFLVNHSPTNRHLVPFTSVRDPITKLHPSVAPRTGVNDDGDVDPDSFVERLSGLVDAESFANKSQIDKVIASREFVNAMKRHNTNSSALSRRAYEGGKMSTKTEQKGSTIERPISPIQEPMSTSIPLMPYMHTICLKCGLYKQECICGFAPKNIVPFKSAPPKKEPAVHADDGIDEGSIQSVHVQPVPQLRRNASLL